MTKKDALVTIGCIVLLAATMGFTARRNHEHARQVLCAANCKTLHSAFMNFMAENNGSSPVAGGPGDNEWASLGWQDNYWNIPDYEWSGNDSVTLTASLYLLVKYNDAHPRLFVCPNGEERPFGTQTEGSAPEPPDPDMQLASLWDFGPTPWIHVNYSYHCPYQTFSHYAAFPLTSMSAPQMAVLADKNPWCDSDLCSLSPSPYSGLTAFVALINQSGRYWDDVFEEELIVGNSNNHGRRGQNVLFMDGGVRFCRRSDVALNYDNIYTSFYGSSSNWSDPSSRRRGYAYIISDSDHIGWVKSEQDSVLVGDETAK